MAEQPRGDYYGALVGVSVFAAIAVVALVILLMIMVRRQHSVTANITSRGKSEAAFDNPSFKVSNINRAVNIISCTHEIKIVIQRTCGCLW